MKVFSISSLIFFLFLSYGCSNLFKAPLYDGTSPNEKFVQLCKKEFGYDIVTKTVGNTQWVYFPIQHDILSLKPNKLIPGASDKKPRKFSVQYLDVRLENEIFEIAYDIIPSTKPPKDYGYGNAYQEEYTKEQNNIFTTIVRTYFTVEEMPSEAQLRGLPEEEKGKRLEAYLERAKTPNFFVIVIADIVRGLETEQIVYLEDFKRYMAQEMPMDEYTKRQISEFRGSTSIIDDREGKHLDYREITWEEFLPRQISSQISFKYQSSDFQPSGNTPMEIAKVVGEATSAYGFKHFTQLQLKDLRSKDTYLFDRSQLP